MFSVTYTGMNLRPLCTAIVCPTISGITVDRRDQVLMTFFSPPRFITSTFSSSGTSTNGPFLSDLDMSVSSYQLPVTSSQPQKSFWKLGTGNWKLFRSSLHNEPIRALPVPRLVSLGRLSPRRYRMTAARRLAFTSAQRVIDRVPRTAAPVRPFAEPSAAPRFADRDVFVIDIADLA